MKLSAGRKLVVSSSLFVAILLLGCAYVFPDSGATARPTQTSPQGNASQAAPAEPLPVEPTSSYWHAFLWEAMPTEWLSNPNKKVILDAYQQKDWKPIFFNSRFELTEGGQRLLERLGSLEKEGVDLKPYRLDYIAKTMEKLSPLRDALRASDPRWHDARAEFPDVSNFENPEGAQLSSSSIQGDEVSSRGALEPGKQSGSQVAYRAAFRAASEVDVRLANNFIRAVQEMNPCLQEKEIDVLVGRIPMAEFLKELAPASADYALLAKAYGYYKQLALQPQMRVNAASPIRPGETGDQVRNLQKRLQQEDFYKGKITGQYDAPTQEAIKRFQVAHSMDPDGVVGQKTIEWLNSPYEKKVMMIAQSMKALRQSQGRCSGRFVRINIPQFILEYHKDGKVRDVHRIIVGKASGKKVKLQGRLIGENHTPPLESVIEQVVFNPRWYVSDRIRRELADEIAADPNYFAKHGYVQMASLYPWGEPRLFQLPGPTNPLGRVKFEFPNPYAVFLHDTPKKGLFQRSRRDFSHGCIRVEGARQLAEIIIADDQNPAAQKIDSFLEQNRPTHVKLNQPLPIVIEYMTASPNQHGQVVFCSDIYGWFEEDNVKKNN